MRIYLNDIETFAAQCKGRTVYLLPVEENIPNSFDRLAKYQLTGFNKDGQIIEYAFVYARYVSGYDKQAREAIEKMEKYRDLLTAYLERLNFKVIAGFISTNTPINGVLPSLSILKETPPPSWWQRYFRTLKERRSWKSK